MKVFVFVALALALAHSGSAQVEKLASCCTSTSSDQIREKITAVIPQLKNGQCVLAAIVQTEKGLFCVFPGAPWFQKLLQRQKIAYAKAQAAAAPSKVTLMSILSSSAPPLSSTTVRASSSEPTQASSSASSIASSSEPTQASSIASSIASSSSSSSAPSDLQTSTEVSSGEPDYYD